MDIASLPPDVQLEEPTSLLNKKNIFTFLIIGILLLVIPVGVKLVQEQQLLKSKAAVDPIVFTGPNVSKNAAGEYVAKDPTVQVELRSPLGPPVPK